MLLVYTNDNITMLVYDWTSISSRITG